MYFLSRLFMRLSVLLGIYALILAIVIGWPMSGVLAAAARVAHTLRGRKLQRTTLGSARWASERDLDRAGMLGAASGLLLGRIYVQPRRLRSILSVIWGRISSREACERFCALFQRHRVHVVRANRAIHTATFAPSGLGKGVSLVVPFLQESEDSCVVVDFKGELAMLTADHCRQAFGHQVVLLDPYGVVTKTPDSFNALQEIDAMSATALDACNDIAKALVVRSGEEKDPHWNDSAEAWISAMLATVVRYGGSHGMRSLQTMRDLLSSPERIGMALQLMRESDAWDGMLARAGGQLEHMVDRERSSTLSTVARHLRFLDTPAIAASTQASSFDASALSAGKMTIYLILPPDHMRSQMGLLRLWITSFLRSIVKGGLNPEHQVHFVLDEAASLGQLEAIEDALDKYRGYGVRLHFFFQSAGQLRKCFPNGQDQTLLSNTTQIYFGVNDMATAELVSARLGEHTITVESGGTSDGTSLQRSMGGQPQVSSGQNFGTNQNWQLQARKLLKPEEVIGLPPRIAVTFTPGVPPICTELLRYFEEPKRRPSWISSSLAACRTLAMGLLCFAIALVAAITLTQAITRSTG